MSKALHEYREYREAIAQRDDAIKEVERLWALNAELVTMLEVLNAWSNNSQQQVWCEARAAIAKAREK